MSLAEIDEEFRRMRKLIDEGTAHFEARAFEEAQNVLFQALKQMDALKMPASGEKVECLEKLADAYYAQKRFIESRAVYQQLKATIEGYDLIEPEDKARILFKLARSTDQVQDYENAAEIFEQAQETAESCMESGAPLLTEIYEAYSSVLRRARLEPDKLKNLERKARASRQKQAGISESLFDPVSEEKRRKRQEEEEAYFRSLSKAQKLIHLARTHPWSALAVLFSPVMLAFATLVLVASMAMLGIDIGFVQSLNKGDVYSTPDSAIKIIVESPVRALIKSTTAAPVKIRNLNRWSELVTSMHQGQGQYWLKRTPEKLIGEDGISFLRSDNSLLKVRKAMQELGTALFKRIEDGKNAVVDASQLSAYGLNVKEFEPDITFHVVRFAPPREGNDRGPDPDLLSASQFLDGLENGTSDISACFFPAEAPFSGETPLSIVCFTHKNAFGIVALDFAGHRMRTSDGSAYLLCSTANATVIPPALNGTHAKFIPNVIGRKELLIGDRTREDVKKKYFHLFLAMMLLLFLIPMGVMLVRQSKRETVKFDYYSNPDASRLGESLWWFTFGVMCLSYFAYIGWILCF